MGSNTLTAGKSFQTIEGHTVTLEKQISTGHFCEMWRGTIAFLDKNEGTRPCAIKAIINGRDSDASIKAEVDHYDQLSSEEHIRLLSKGATSDNEFRYIVLSLGEPVYPKDLVKLSTIDKFNFLIDLAKDIVRIHKVGLIHCDIKIENTIKINGHYSFCDYGSMTSVGNLVGIKKQGKRYAPPECQGKERTEARPSFDAYYFGWLIYEMFQGDNKKGADTNPSVFPPMIRHSNNMSLIPLDTINGIIEDALLPSVEQRETMPNILERLREASSLIIDANDIPRVQSARIKEKRLWEVRKARYQSPKTGIIDDVEGMKTLLKTIGYPDPFLTIECFGEIVKYVLDDSQEKTCKLKSANPFSNEPPLEIAMILLDNKQGIVLATSDNRWQKLILF